MKQLIIAMSILGMFFGCKSKEKVSQNDNAPVVEQKRTMPEGRLMRVHYNFGGMMMEQFSDFNLRRLPDGKGNEFTFRHYNREVSFTDGVSDTLFDAARRIIEEERMYEYVVSYSLQMSERILDGYHWDFEADFEGDDHLSSSGSHVSPEGNGLSRLSKLLREAAGQLVKDEQ